MSEPEDELVPADFELLPTGRGFTDVLQPCYQRFDGKTVALGLRVEHRHCAIGDFCHSVVLMILADMTGAAGVEIACGRKARSPTLNLSMDFIAAARLGQWLEAQIIHLSIKRDLGFCSGVINNTEGVVARFNGTFELPDFWC